MADPSGLPRFSKIKNKWCKKRIILAEEKASALFMSRRPFLLIGHFGIYRL